MVSTLFSGTLNYIYVEESSLCPLLSVVGKSVKQTTPGVVSVKAKVTPEPPPSRPKEEPRSKNLGELAFAQVIGSAYEGPGWFESSQLSKWKHRNEEIEKAESFVKAKIRDVLITFLYYDIHTREVRCAYSIIRCL
jgi:hypothetical protein